MRPARKRKLVDGMRTDWGVSIRRACRVIEFDTSTYHYKTRRLGQAGLEKRIKEICETRVRYGYRRVHVLLRREGWRVNAKRVARIWRQEGLKVPKKQAKRGRIWLNDGSCIRHRPEHRNHVWAYDFVADRTQDGRPLKMLTVVDEYTRESLAIEVGRRKQSIHVLETLAHLFG